jgi:peptidoglycan/LPS O-acetylase OafA/YrhL
MAHFLFYRGDGVFWTIAAEYAFYLLLPPIVWAIGRFGSKWLVFFAVGYFLWFLAILMGISITPLKFVDIGYHRSQYLDVFICGVLVVYVSKRLPYKLVAALFWGLILATVILVSANFLGAEQPLYKIRWLSLVYGVIFALGVISTEQGNPYFTKILRLPLLVFVGQMAFGWYLLHLAVFSVVNQYGPPSGVLRLLISTLLCAGVAYLALRIIEKPGIKLGRWIETRVIHRRSVQPGSGGLVAKAKNDG